MKTTEQLEVEMYELRNERIFLSTQLAMEMEGYYNNQPLSIDRMQEIRAAIATIDAQLMPLQNEYEKHFHNYYVRFSSEIPDVFGGNISRYYFHNIMRSKIDCNIDTRMQRDWINIPNARNLMNDLAKNFINSYSNVRFDIIVKQLKP